MKLLVTGGGGWLAPAVASELRRRHKGASVRLVRRQDCDLSDPAAAARLVARLRPDAIFHLAGAKRGGWSDLWRAHVATTRNLAEALLALPPKSRGRLIVAGSAGEYGAAAGRRPVDETCATRPVTAYGASKLCQTLAALSYRHRGLDVVAARIFNVIGPGIPAHLAVGAFASQIAAIERGQARPTLVTGNLRSRRDLIDVRDVASALACLLEKGKAGEVYNVCTGRATSIGEALDVLLRQARRPIIVKRRPGAPARADVPVVVGAWRKLARDSGWRPAVPLAESLRDSLSWHRRQGI